MSKDRMQYVNKMTCMLRKAHLHKTYKSLQSARQVTCLHSSAERPRSARRQQNGASEAFLQGRHRECFHDSPRRLGLHHHNLAKHLLLTSLCGKLLTRLYHAQAWEHKLSYPM